MAEQDAFGKDIMVSGPPLEALREGDELRLTLDEVIQFIAQEELGRGVESAGAAGGSIVVLDPRSGEVLAMANVPFFNPNEPAACTQAALRNRSIGDALEPGSIMKTFLLSAALEERAVTRETLFNCENGAMPFQGGVLHDVHPYGVLDRERHHRQVEQHRFDEDRACASARRTTTATSRPSASATRPASTCPGEAVGMLRPVARWSGRSIASVAIGQEISVTPLQMATAFAAAVNGGVLWQPRVARELVSPEGTVLKSFEPQKVRQVISAETSRQVVETLVHVVEEGTGKAAAVDGLHGRRQDRHRAEVRPAAEDLLLAQVPRLVRRRGPGARPAAGGPGHDRRAAGRDLRRQRGRPGLPAGRAAHAALPQRPPRDARAGAARAGLPGRRRMKSLGELVAAAGGAARLVRGAPRDRHRGDRDRFARGAPGRALRRALRAAAPTATASSGRPRPPAPRRCSSEPGQGAAAPPGVALVEAANVRRALGAMADRFFDHPSGDLQLVGVTGTNGKTTVTWLLEAIVRAAGRVPGVIGTIACRWGGRERPAGNTTPEAPELQRLLREMADAGVQVAALEASSHALELDRLVGCRFAVAVFTNLGRDHLDFHPDLEALRRRQGAALHRVRAGGERDQRRRPLRRRAWPAAARRRVVTYGLGRRGGAARRRDRRRRRRRCASPSRPRGGGCRSPPR